MQSHKITIPRRTVIAALGATSVHILSSIASHQEALRDEATEEAYHFVFGNLVAIHESLPLYEMLQQAAQKKPTLSELDQLVVNGFQDAVQQFKTYFEPYIEIQKAQQKH